jgi:uncharacterized membrane protein
MSSFTESITVDVPIHTAYNQWTQFEEFPRFMEGVERVDQLDDTHLHWVAEIAGKHEEWDAEIVDQKPDQRVAWRNTTGTTNTGAVMFREVGPSQTEVMVTIEYEPDGLLEKAGDALGIVQRRTKGDLERFKGFIEGRGTETGAWRGEVDRRTA